MSIVVIPFLEEDPAVVVSNLVEATRHPRVEAVFAIAAGEGPTFAAVNDARPASVELMIEERIGSFRPGKGDAMLTGFRRFLDSDADRIHFYDADITTFDASWIDKAERAADRGYDAVRHYYPRAATDAMITWWVTRTGFALGWPDTDLPWIEQPLSGELLLTRDAAQRLWDDPRVRSRSDWGIDTAITFASVAHGMRIYESYIRAGKDHALYGSLADIRTMAVECFATIQACWGDPIPGPVTHHVEAPSPAPDRIVEKKGYDIESTLELLRADPAPGEEELYDALPPRVAAGIRRARREPVVSFLDDEAWWETYLALIDGFRPGDAAWESLLFRLWVARVVSYTWEIAMRGHRYADGWLHDMIIRAMSSPLSRR